MLINDVYLYSEQYIDVVYIIYIDTHYNICYVIHKYNLTLRIVAYVLGELEYNIRAVYL